MSEDFYPYGRVRGGDYGHSGKHARPCGIWGLDMTGTDEKVGFRLTVDMEDDADYNRGVRGGSWTTPDIISSRGFSNGPDVSYYNTHIGLRLVSEAGAGQAFRGSGWYSGSGLRRAYRGVDKVPNVSIGIRTVRDT